MKLVHLAVYSVLITSMVSVTSCGRRVPVTQGMNGVHSNTEQSLDKVPTVVERSEPLYSETAREARLEGTVILEGVVQENGTFRVTNVLNTLPMGLEENAKLALERWRFKPGSRGGQPIDVPVRIEVVFQLR